MEAEFFRDKTQVEMDLTLSKCERGAVPRSAFVVTLRPFGLFPGKGLGLGFSLSGGPVGPYPEIYCAFEDMRDLY